VDNWLILKDTDVCNLFLLIIFSDWTRDKFVVLLLRKIPNFRCNPCLKLYSKIYIYQPFLESMDLHLNDLLNRFKFRACIHFWENSSCALDRGATLKRNYVLCFASRVNPPLSVAWRLRVGLEMLALSHESMFGLVRIGPLPSIWLLSNPRFNTFKNFIVGLGLCECESNLPDHPHHCAFSP